MIIDTSIWVDYFKARDDSVCRIVDALLDDNTACYNGVILTELLVGIKSDREKKLVRDYMGGLRYLQCQLSFFQKAGELGRGFRRQGLSVPFSDLLIATHALIFDLPVLTRDKHFTFMQDIIAIKVGTP